MEDEMETIFPHFFKHFLKIKTLAARGQIKRLLDMPNYRKHHQGLSLIGGVAIFIGVVITSLIFVKPNYQIQNIYSVHHQSLFYWVVF